MKKVNKILIFLLTLVIIVTPMLIFADGLVPCGKAGTGIESHPCTFNDVFALINGVINFTFKVLVVPIAALMFAFAGFKMITSGGSSPEARSAAKSVFMNTTTGLVIAAGCYLFIKMLLIAVGYKFVTNWFN